MHRPPRPKTIRKRAAQQVDEDAPVSITSVKRYLPMRVVKVPDADVATSDVATSDVATSDYSHKYQLQPFSDACGEISRKPLELLLQEPYYYDNTQAFSLLLEPFESQIILFPSGSGKTILAKMFETYCSKNADHNSYVSQYLEKESAFFQSNKDLFKVHLRKHSVIYISFAKFRKCEDYEQLKQELEKVAETVFRDFHKGDGKGVENVFCERIRQLIESKSMAFRPIIIIDSIDTAYNAIAGLPNDELKRCKKLLRETTDFQYPEVSLIYFGVSPYLMETVATGHSHRSINIGMHEVDLEEIFSMSASTIATAIEKMELPITVGEVIAHSSMQYFGITYNNPMLATQYLRAVKIQSSPVLWEMKPRFNAIFHQKDITFLHDSLELDYMIVGSFLRYSFEDVHQACCNIPVNDDGAFLRSFFTWGGYFSLEPVEINGKPYNKIKPSNLSTRAILSKILDTLVLTEIDRFKPHVLDAFMIRAYQLVCDLLYCYLQPCSTLFFNDEKDYNNLLHEALRGVSVLNNPKDGGTIPDLVITQRHHRAFIEIKLLKFKEWKTKLPKKQIKNCMTGQVAEIFDETERVAFNEKMDAAKWDILRKIKNSRPANLDPAEPIDLIGIVFGRNMVLLHHSKYNYGHPDAVDFRPYSSFHLLDTSEKSNPAAPKSNPAVPKSNPAVPRSNPKRKAKNVFTRC